MKKFVILIVTTTLIACSQTPNNINRQIGEQEFKNLSAIPSLSQDQGLSLLKVHCYTCHNPKSISHDDMLAPPLAGIKYKYKSLYPKRELFIAQMSDFIKSPSKENAVMKGPVRRFGLMPNTTVPSDQINELVAFIYDNEVESPNWFPEHFEEQHGRKWSER